MNVLCWRSGLSALCRPFGSNSALRRRCHVPASVPLVKEAEITKERPYLDINEEIRGTEILPFVSANEVDFSQKKFPYLIGDPEMAQNKVKNNPWVSLWLFQFNRL